MLTLTLEAETYEELTKMALQALSRTPQPQSQGTAAVTEVEAKVTPAAAEEVKAEQAKRGRKAKEEDKPQISTGEPREEPASAPAESGNGAAPALTHQDIRDLMGSYANTFGMKAVQLDGPVILSRLFGEGKVRASDIPDNPDALKKAFDALNKAIETNEFKRALAS